jgi:hypothetical protein
VVIWGIVSTLLFFTGCKAYERLRVEHIFEVIGVDLLSHSTSEDIRDTNKKAQDNQKIQKREK